MGSWLSVWATLGGKASEAFGLCADHVSNDKGRPEGRPVSEWMLSCRCRACPAGYPRVPARCGYRSRTTCISCKRGKVRGCTSWTPRDRVLLKDTPGGISNQTGASLPIMRDRRETVTFRSHQAPVAQRIEHLTTDQKVAGSNPTGRAFRKRRIPHKSGGFRVSRAGSFVGCPYGVRRSREIRRLPVRRT